MHGAWVSFPATGNPGQPAGTTGTRTTMRFDTVSATEGASRTC
jgi:hypothetical protein